MEHIALAIFTIGLATIANKYHDGVAAIFAIIGGIVFLTTI